MTTKAEKVNKALQLLRWEKWEVAALKKQATEYRFDRYTCYGSKDRDRVLGILLRDKEYISYSLTRLGNITETDVEALGI